MYTYWSYSWESQALRVCVYVCIYVCWCLCVPPSVYIAPLFWWSVDSCVHTLFIHSFERYVQSSSESPNDWPKERHKQMWDEKYATKHDNMGSENGERGLLKHSLGCLFSYSCSPDRLGIVYTCLIFHSHTRCAFLLWLLFKMPTLFK